MLTPAELTLLADEIHRLAIPARVDKIHQPRPDRVVLRLVRDGVERSLLIAAARGFARAHFVEAAPQNPRTPPPFCEDLRRLLMPGRLVSASTLPNDCVLVLGFETRGEGESPAPRRLVAELFGAHPNLAVVDAAGTILAALDASERKGRTFTPGTQYVEPPRRARELAPRPPFSTLSDPSPPGLRGETAPAGIPAAPLSSLLEASVTPIELAALLDASRASLLTELRQQEKKLRRRLENIEADIRGAEAIPRLRREGELLKANLGRLKRGMKQFVATEWRGDREEQVTIALDPRRTPHDEVGSRFDEARRLERLKEAAAERMSEVREHLDALADLASRAEAAGSEDALGAIRRDAGIEARPIAAPGRKPEPRRIEPRKPYRTFVSKDGIDILVGRTAADNDELTFHVANGNDFWFHVRDYPGSHVVVRAREQLPEETLLDAATLAVHFSRGAHGGKRDVSWTRRKFVSKARGAPKGQVLLSAHKTLHLRPDPERLARLLAPRGPADRADPS